MPRKRTKQPIRRTAAITTASSDDSTLPSSLLIPAPNLDVAQIRAIVEAERQKAGTEAVLFGMWQGDRELLTVALGNSMTTVPATTDMHYRIGGIIAMAYAGAQ